MTLWNERQCHSNLNWRLVQILIWLDTWKAGHIPAFLLPEQLHPYPSKLPPTQT